MEHDKKCTHILDNGEKCRAWALKDKVFCFSHDPESKDAKALAVRNGGLVKPIRIETALEAIEVKTPTDVVMLLGTAISEVRSGVLPQQVANTIGFLSGHLLKAFEQASLNEKVNEIKSVLSGRQGKSNNRRK